MTVVCLRCLARWESWKKAPSGAYISRNLYGIDDDCPCAVARPLHLGWIRLR